MITIERIISFTGCTIGYMIDRGIPDFFLWKILWKNKNGGKYCCNWHKKFDKRVYCMSNFFLPGVYTFWIILLFLRNFVKL